MENSINIMSSHVEKRKIAISMIFWGIILFVCVLLYFIDPSGGVGFFPCPIYFLTGLYCPGCGTTRAIYSILHGDFFGAVSFNIAFVILAPFIVAYLFVKTLEFIGVVSLKIDSKLNNKMLIAIIVLLLVYGVVRNIPFEPYMFLAPRG